MRYPAIDVLRGLALVSMVSAHATGWQMTPIGRVAHAGRWIDGAFLFVALSGLVTGLVHRRIVERRGVRASGLRLVRRAGWLYLVHLGLSLFIVGLASESHSRRFVDTPVFTSLAQATPMLSRVAALNIEPNLNNVLPMYVFFLLWAALAVVLLRQGRWWAVVTISSVVYLVGQRFGGLALGPGLFQLAGWQALFTGGLLVGWTWEHERAAVSLGLRRAVIWVSAVGAIALLALARFAPAGTEHLVGRGLTKANGGWLAFLFAGMIIVAGYALIEWLRARGASRPLQLVAVLGLKGLPGYATMVIVVALLDVASWAPRNDAAILAIVVLCGLAEYGSVRLDAWWRARPTTLLVEPVVVTAPAGR